MSGSDTRRPQFDLEAIEKRQRVIARGLMGSSAGVLIREDVPALVAEVHRLRGLITDGVRVADHLGGVAGVAVRAALGEDAT